MENINTFARKNQMYFWMLIFIIFIMALNLSFNFFFHKTVFRESDKFVKAKEIDKKLKDKLISREGLEKALMKEPVLTLLFFLFIVFGGIAFLIGCVLLSVCLILRLNNRQILPKPAILTKEADWDISDVFRIVILFLFYGYLLNISEAFLFGFLRIRPDQNIQSAVNTSLMDIVAIMLVLYFVTKKYGQAIVRIGLSLKDWLKNIWLGIAGYVTIIPVLVLVLIAVIWIISLLGYEPPPQPVVEMFLAADKKRILIFLTIMVSIIGPFAEELFFRGFAYNAVKKKLGFSGAILITSGLFAILHADVVGFFPIFVLGLLLAYLYEKTGSLIPSITVHILHNSATISLLLLFKRIAEIT